VKKLWCTSLLFVSIAVAFIACDSFSPTEPDVGSTASAARRAPAPLAEADLSRLAPGLGRLASPAAAGSVNSCAVGEVGVCDEGEFDCEDETDDDETLAETFFPDGDGDGFGDQSDLGGLACSQPAGFSLDNTDCDDADAAINPDAAETCDGIDNDCDGEVDDDIADIVTGTDVGACLVEIQSCIDGAIQVVQAGVVPEAEICDDSIDNDCNGQIDEDCSAACPCSGHSGWGGALERMKQDQVIIRSHCSASFEGTIVAEGGCDGCGLRSYDIGVVFGLDGWTCVAKTRLIFQPRHSVSISGLSVSEARGCWEEIVATIDDRLMGQCCNRPNNHPHCPLCQLGCPAPNF